MVVALLDERVQLSLCVKLRERHHFSSHLAAYSLSARRGLSDDSTHSREFSPAVVLALFSLFKFGCDRFSIAVCVKKLFDRGFQLGGIAFSHGGYLMAVS